MSLLGNLLTDVYDRESRATLSLFVADGGLAALQRCLRAPEPTNLFACATLQNVTSLDPFDTCAKLREQGCAADLLTLVSSSDETVSSYATAVLANLRAYDPFAEDDDEVEEAIRMRRLSAIVEQMRTGKAVATVQGAAIRWVRRRHVEMQADKDKAALEAALRDAPPFSARAVEEAEVTRSVAERGVSAFVTASSDSIADALAAIRATAEVAFGADASAIGAAVRDGGAIPHLVACIGSSDSDVQHSAMSLLGNLLTDVYDRESRATLALFVAAGGLAALQRCLRAPEPTNLFACAALQNVTSLDPFDTCAKLREQGCAADLRSLVCSSDQTVSSYATAVLANLRAYDPFSESDEAVEEAIRKRRLAALVEQMRTGKAVASVQAAALRWIRRRREILSSMREQGKDEVRGAVPSAASDVTQARTAVPSPAPTDGPSSGVSHGLPLPALLPAPPPPLQLGIDEAEATRPTLVDELKDTVVDGMVDSGVLEKLLYKWVERLDGASEDTAVALCEELRASGAVAVISNLLTHESAKIYQLAIYLVGNLASEAFDPHASLSKRELKQAGAFELLLHHLFSTDDVTLLMTLCAIQNMCMEIEYVDALKKAGGIKRLRIIVSLANPQLLPFAQGCLDNVRLVYSLQTMQQKVLMSKAEATQVLDGFVRRRRARQAAANK